MKPRKFETERTRRFRASELSEQDERTIANVETYGCEIIQVKKSSTGQGWSYTLGIFDTCHQPEIIAIGLPEKTAHFLLNEAAKRLRDGISLAEGRHQGLIAEVQCEFRPVDKKWLQKLVGWDIWYYEGTDFPVLQAVYPDRANRFPGEEGFDQYFQQPLLQPNAQMGEVEKDFWASTDPSSSLFDWKFPDPPHTRVFLSEMVYSGAEPVTYVSHDMEDGAWQFLGDSMSGQRTPVISCFHHPIDVDPSLKELADLPLGWCAERSKPDSPWIRRPLTPTSSDEATEA